MSLIFRSDSSIKNRTLKSATQRKHYSIDIDWLKINIITQKPGYILCLGLFFIPFKLIYVIVPGLFLLEMVLNTLYFEAIEETSKCSLICNKNKEYLKPSLTGTNQGL